MSAISSAWRWNASPIPRAIQGHYLTRVAANIAGCVSHDRCAFGIQKCAGCAAGSASVPWISMKQHLRDRAVYDYYQATSQIVAIPMTFGRETIAEPFLEIGLVGAGYPDRWVARDISQLTGGADESASFPRRRFGASAEA